MNRYLRFGLLATATALTLGAQADPSSELNPQRYVHHRPSGDQASGEAPTAGGTTSLSAISNHGGPILAGQPNIHVIWYGNWAQSNGTDNAGGQQIVRDLFRGLSGSNYLAISKSYTASNGAVSGLLGSYAEGTDTGSQGTKLTDAKVKAVVQSYINSKGAADPNAIYFVLSSSNVSESSGFCTQYCGWHTNGTLSGQNVKYSFVGNAARCLSGCAPQSVSPNGNAGVDGMSSVIAHELEETLSDPNLNAWYDASGAENGDKCAWTFGSHQTLMGSGAYYNMSMGGRNFLIQRNLWASDNKCYTDKINNLQ